VSSASFMSLTVNVANTFMLLYAGKHLHLLGLPTESVIEEKTLKTAFLQQAKEWHPDRHTGAAKVRRQNCNPGNRK
jgi:hypothetical protein